MNYGYSKLKLALTEYFDVLTKLAKPTRQGKNPPFLEIN